MRQILSSISNSFLFQSNKERNYLKLIPKKSNNINANYRKSSNKNKFISPVCRHVARSYLLSRSECTSKDSTNWKPIYIFFSSFGSSSRIILKLPSSLIKITREMSLLYLKEAKIHNPASIVAVKSFKNKNC